MYTFAPWLCSFDQYVTTSRNIQNTPDKCSCLLEHEQLRCTIVPRCWFGNAFVFATCLWRIFWNLWYKGPDLSRILIGARHTKLTFSYIHGSCFFAKSYGLLSQYPFHPISSHFSTRQENLNQKVLETFKAVQVVGHGHWREAQFPRFHVVFPCSCGYL